MNFDVYQQKETFLHRLDPRIKVVALLELLVFVFLPLNYYFLAIFSISTIIFSNIEMGAKTTWKVFKSVLAILIIMVLFSPMYKDQLPPILYISSWPILYHKGIKELLTIGSRFILITYGFALLLFSTSQKKLLLALRSFKLSYNASIQISLILNFLPQIATNFSLIQDSHKLRQTNKKISKIAQLLPNLVSTFVMAIKTIPLTAMALELRGFGRSNKRTNFVSLPSAKITIFPIFLFSLFFILLSILFI